MISGDLVAVFDYYNRSFSLEVDFIYKLRLEFDSIIRIYIESISETRSFLEIEVNMYPMFFIAKKMDMNGPTWHETLDFTNQTSQLNNLFVLQFSKALLNGPIDILLSEEKRFHGLLSKPNIYSS